MLEKNGKLHPNDFVEHSLPLANISAPRSVVDCHKVDAFGLHVLLLGARERHISLLDPLFKNANPQGYDARLDVLVGREVISEESHATPSHYCTSTSRSYDFLASIEPHARAASLLLEGRIVHPFSLLTTQQLLNSPKNEEQITFVLSFPSEDKSLVATSTALLTSIDDGVFETVDWWREEHAHFDTPLTRYTLSIRPRPTTLVFPLGAPSL